MAEYLKRALEGLQPRDMESRGGLARALAARRGTGDVVSALTGGRAGQGMQAGADPIEYYSGEQDREQNRVLKRAMLERQSLRDQAEDKYRGDVLGLRAADILSKNTRRGGIGGAKLPADAEKQILSAKNALAGYGALKGDIAQLDSGQRNNLDSAIYEIMTNPLGTGLKNIADSAMYDPPVKNIISQIAAMDAETRHALFGSQLTEGEQKSATAFLPGTYGLDLDTRLDRIGGTEERLTRKLREYENQYGVDLGLGESAPSSGGSASGLTPEEAAELAELEREFGGG